VLSLDGELSRVDRVILLNIFVLIVSTCFA
jgi:hypothetical protein